MLASRLGDDLLSFPVPLCCSVVSVIFGLFGVLVPFRRSSVSSATSVVNLPSRAFLAARAGGCLFFTTEDSEDTEGEEERRDDQTPRRRVSLAPRPRDGGAIAAARGRSSVSGRHAGQSVTAPFLAFFARGNSGGGKTLKGNSFTIVSFVTRSLSS